MTITSIGYAGSIGWAAWAQMARDLGTDYGIDGVDDLKVVIKAAAAGEITVSAGTAHGQGIIDTSDSTITLAGLTATNTWYTIVVRRDWTGGPGAEVTTILALAGNAAKAIASARQVGAGVIDDQPIALVHRGSTLDQVVDLRCWWGNGGLYAASVDALAYLGRPGSEVRVGSSTFSRRLGAQWVELPDSIHADRVTDGVLNPARIPNLDAAKITGGVLNAARIPPLPASRISEGVLDPARIPTIPSEKVKGRWTQEVATPGNVEGRVVVGHELVLARTLRVDSSAEVRALLTAHGGIDAGNAVRAPWIGTLSFGNGAHMESGGGLRSANHSTTTASANVRYTDTGWLWQVSSLRRDKLSIEDLDVDALSAVRALRPRTWFDRSATETLADALTRRARGKKVELENIEIEHVARIPGFVAEEVAEIGGLPAEFVTRAPDGTLTGVAYDRIPALLTVAIQQLVARVEAQDAQIAALTSAVEALAGPLSNPTQED